MANKRVLLVEDDLETRDALEDLLEAEGFDVIPAGNGKQALEVLAFPPGNRPALVVLALDIPLVSGWQVLDSMRGRPELAHIPVVVVSGGQDHDKPPGASTLMTKPLSLSAFRDTIHGYLETDSSTAA
jgi:CheY-like chemotaxis protein